jgi:hypothetical protein
MTHSVRGQSEEECLRWVRRDFSEEQLLALVVGFQTFACKLAKAYRLPPQGSARGEER